MRRLAALLVLAFALALPASTLAVETSGTTNEVFTLLPPTISMTVPVEADYTVAHGIAAGDITLTDIATNNWSGLTITARFSALSKTLVDAEVTPVIIPTTDRAFGPDLPPDPAGFLTAGQEKTLAKSSILNATAWYEIATTTAEVGPVSGRWLMTITPVSVPGLYSGTIDFKASTNP